MTLHGHGSPHHDWHSTEYVDDWIERDVTRDEQRRLHLRRMLAAATLPPAAKMDVLDIGAGYGIVTQEVLLAFPNAQATLHDYSQPMLDHARRRLAANADRTTYVFSDLSRPDWTNALGKRFDLAVSAIAIHNLASEGRIPQIYGEVASVLKPGAAFLNYEIVSFTGGVEGHLEWLRRAGFLEVTCPWQDEHNAILVARIG